MKRLLSWLLIAAVSVPAFAGTIVIEGPFRAAAAGGGGSDVTVGTIAAPVSDHDDGTTTAPAITVGTLVNGLLALVCTWEDTAAGNASISTVTDSTTQTWARITGTNQTIDFSSASDYSGDMWYVLAPTAATHTLTVTFNEAVRDIFCTIAPFENVNQSSPLGTAVATTDNAGGPASTSLNIGSAAGDMVIGYHVSAGQTVGEQDVSAGTKAWEVLGTNGDVGSAHMGATRAAAGATTTLTFTMAGGRPWAAAGVAIKK